MPGAGILLWVQSVGHVGTKPYSEQVTVILHAVIMVLFRNCRVVA
jgi:hypothetical protein